MISPSADRTATATQLVALSTGVSPDRWHHFPQLYRRRELLLTGDPYLVDLATIDMDAAIAELVDLAMASTDAMADIVCERRDAAAARAS